MRTPNPEGPTNIPDWAQDLEGLVSTGAVSGSGDGQMINYAVLRENSADLDGSAMRRLGNGAVLLSSIFPVRPDSDESVPPSQSEVVRFLAAAENSANGRLTGLLPSAQWSRPERHALAWIKPEQRRLLQIAKTQSRLIELGFSIDIRLTPPKAK